MTLAGFVLYADVADTLAPDVRETIELSLPCAGGFEHLWDREQSSVMLWGSYHPVRVDEFWRCVHCGVVSHDDPRSRVERERPLASAHLEDFL